MPFFRNSCLCLLGAALATCVLTTGCQSSQPVETTSQPATTTQPASNETVVYNKWEVETHRPHVDIEKRPPAEQKEYQNWRQQHPNGR